MDRRQLFRDGDHYGMQFGRPALYHTLLSL